MHITGDYRFIVLQLLRMCTLSVGSEGDRGIKGPSAAGQYSQTRVTLNNTPQQVSLFLNTLPNVAVCCNPEDSYMKIELLT